MKFLVLGCSGMAGHVISLYLKEHRQQVVGFSRRPVNFVESITGDVTDTQLLAQVVSQGDYDVVINAIGILNRAAEENKDQAVFLNAYLPHLLARLTTESKTRVFHMSTDCVFKGNTGPYTEKSIPDGTTFYDRTKALGELVDEKNLTIRCSIVGPDINVNGIGLFNWFMKQRGTVHGYTRAMWTGLATTELARLMLLAAERKAKGLINLVPSHSISKCDLLGLFNRSFQGSSVKVIPDDKVNLDKSLIRTNFSCSLSVKDYPEQIEEMYRWVCAHRNLYPNYAEAFA